MRVLLLTGALIAAIVTPAPASVVGDMKYVLQYIAPERVMYSEGTVTIVTREQELAWKNFESIVDIGICSTGLMYRPDLLKGVREIHIANTTYQRGYAIPDAAGICAAIKGQNSTNRTAILQRLSKRTRWVPATGDALSEKPKVVVHKFSSQQHGIKVLLTYTNTTYSTVLSPVIHCVAKDAQGQPLTTNDDFLPGPFKSGDTYDHTAYLEPTPGVQSVICEVWLES